MNPDTILSIKPDIRLYGKVDESMLSEFLRQQGDIAPDRRDVLIELSTSGGNADIGRRIASEIGQWRRSGRQQIHFLGKSFVYSAGVTIMSAIEPRLRYLGADCELLIHERKIKKTLNLDGALRACRSLVHDALAEIDSGQRLEREGFAQLVEGTDISIDQLMSKVLERDWYLTPKEALDLRLVGAVV